MTPNEFITFVLNSDTDECLIYPRQNPNVYWGNNYRKVCILKHGEPKGDRNVARHKCNVKGCINWKHLHWGTHLDNVDDYLKTIGKKRQIYKPDRNTVDWIEIVEVKRK